VFQVRLIQDELTIFTLPGSFKDLADIVAELRRTHPLIDRMKDERVELHSRLTNLTILVDKTLQDPECEFVSAK
jgi:hypothetical protein